jgi:hypothetical protein
MAPELILIMWPEGFITASSRIGRFSTFPTSIYIVWVLLHLFFVNLLICLLFQFLLVIVVIAGHHPPLSKHLLSKFLGRIPPSGAGTEYPDPFNLKLHVQNPYHMLHHHVPLPIPATDLTGSMSGDIFLHLGWKVATIVWF